MGRYTSLKRRVANASCVPSCVRYPRTQGAYAAQHAWGSVPNSISTVPSAARAAPLLAFLDVTLVTNTAPLPTLHNACRRCCAQEATPPNARLRNVTFCSLGLDGHPYPWWLPALCFVSGGLRSLFALCTPTSCISVGADPALGPRLHKVGSRALRQPTGVGAPSCQPSACWSDRRHAAAATTALHYLLIRRDYLITYPNSSKYPGVFVPIKIRLCTF